MSWLGGLNESFTQLSSLTGQLGGQISNFTKEVLTEGTEDNIDHEVEAERLKQQLKQFGVHLHEKDDIIEQLKQANALLKEKVNKAELDISTSGIEYEARLQQKSKEIAVLKEKLTDHKEDSVSDLSARALGNPILSSSFSTAPSDVGDDHFHEIISYQQDIERLSHELEETRLQRDSWKEKAESHTRTDHVDGSRENADDSLLNRVKELETALRRESKHHQQELKTMQDAHDVALRRYQDEVRKLKATSSNSNTNASISAADDAECPQELRRIQSEHETLKEQLRTRTRQLQAQKKNIDELKAACADTEKELEGFKNGHASLTDEINKIKIDKLKCLHGSQLKEKTLQDIYAVVKEVTMATEGQTRLVDERNVVELIGGVREFCVQASMRPHDASQRRNDEEDLAESDQWHNVELLDVAEEDQNMPERCTLESQPATEGPSSSQSGTATASHQGNDTRNQGDLTLTLEALQMQVEDYEHEMEQYERAQSEWQVEKQSLQDLLNRYQNEVVEGDSQPEDERTATLVRLKKELEDLKGAKEALEKATNRLVHEKEQLQVATKNLEEELNSSISEMQLERGQVDVLQSELRQCAGEKEKVQAAFESVTQELNRSRSEKDELFEALNDLDNQHQDEMAQLLLVREDLKEKLKAAQERITQMKEENDELTEEAKRLRGQAEQMSSDSTFADSMKLEMETMREKLQAADAEKMANKSHKASVEQDLKDAREEIEKQKLAYEVLETARQRAEQSLSSLQSEIVMLKKSASEMTSQLDEARAECTRLLHENGELRGKTEHDSLQMSADSIRTCEDMRQNIREEQATSESLRNQLEQVSSTLTERENLLRVREEDVQQLEKRVYELQGLLEGNTTTLKNVELEREELVAFESKVETMNLSVLKLEKDVRHSNATLRDKEHQIQKLNTEKLESESKWNSESARLHEEIESLCTELKNAGKDVAQSQSAHEAELKRLRSEHESIVLMIKEESSKRVTELEETFATFKLESQAASKVYVDKISHFEKANAKLLQTVEAAEAKTCQDESDTIINLQRQNSDISHQLQSLLNDHNILKTKVLADHASFDSKLKQEVDQKVQAQNEAAAAKDSVREAEENVAALRLELAAISSQVQDSAEPNENHNEFCDDVLHTKNDCDLRIESLLTETEELKRRLILQKNNTRPTDQLIDGLLAEIRKGDMVDLKKADLSKEDIGSLLRLIKERGEVISLLAQRSAMEDKPVVNITGVKETQDANRALMAEKDQILAVISEKSRENKKLKDETHKMMHVVSESQSALAKVQQENASLRAKYEGYDREMTKEAVGKLSRLVMEKELEITSLKQKCGTLLEVLQQQQPPGGAPGDANMSVSGQQVQSLLQDKETLTSQVQQLLAERNHLVALINQSQGEIERLRSELVNAAKAMERDSDTNSKLQISFGNLVHEYEQTQMKLSNVQREFGQFQKKLSHLEDVKVSLMERAQPVQNNKPAKAFEHNQKSDSAVQDVSSNAALEELREHKKRYEIELEKLTADCREKDVMIHSRTQEMVHLKRDVEVKATEVEILRKSVGNLREQVAGLSKENENRRTEISDYSGRLAEKEAESGAFQETNAQLSMLLKEKEYEIENARDKCRSLQAIAEENQQGKESESQKLLLELDQAKQNLIAARHERDQVMLSLKQRKMEADKYSEEAKTLREKESKLQSELARLRNHLVQVEEAYTQEAILGEDREKTLREQLQQIHNSSSAARQATEQSQQQAESLQEQLRTVIAQRDQAIQQRQLAQEQSVQYATALQKLQAAVERMQREETATFTEQMNAVKTQLDLKKKEVVTLESHVSDLKVKLQDAKEALTSASRLNKQLELKEENIEQLKTLVAEKQLHIDDLQDKIHVVSSKNEGMVDKEIVKNLVIGYFTTPTNKRRDVLHLIMSVLGFSRAEVSKVESGSAQGGKKAGWMGGWLGGWRGSESHHGPGSTPSSPTSISPDQSFTQMFVKFLENESVPHQAARLPAAAMVNESQQKINQRRMATSPVLSSVPTPVGTSTSERAAPAIAGRFSPFLHTNPATSTPARGQGSTHIHSGQPLVMHPVTPILPTFSPMTNVNNVKQDTLQDILLSSADR